MVYNLPWWNCWVSQYKHTKDRIVVISSHQTVYSMVFRISKSDCKG